MNVTQNPCWTPGKPRRVEQGESRSNGKHKNTESREKTQQTNVTERQEQEELKGPKKRPNKLINKTKAREWRHEMTKTHNHNQTTNRRL